MKSVLFLSGALLMLALAMANGGTARAETLTWGNFDCQGGVASRDTQALLREVLSQAPLSQGAGCPAIGTSVNTQPYGSLVWGDTDCDGEIKSRDNQAMLRFILQQTPLTTQQPCPGIGSEIEAAPGVTVTGNVVSAIAGEELVLRASTGDEMSDADETWTDYFDALGVDAGDVNTQSSHPEEGSTVDFRMSAFEADGADWPAGIAELVAGIQAHPESGYLAEVVTLGGRDVVKVTMPSEPTAAATYYLAFGDVLWMIVTSDEGLAEGGATALPGFVPPNASVAVPLGDPPAPGTGIIVVRDAFPVRPPVCVAEPFGRTMVQLMAFDGYYQVPIPVFFTNTGIQRGELRNPVSFGPISDFVYRATSFGAPESMMFQAVAPGGGTGVGFAGFPVQHCLNGTWDDGGRAISISHNGPSVTATFQGEHCGVSGGVDFTATLSAGDDHFSGDDVEVCNPEECVEAGLHEPRDYRPYNAVIANDGNSIDFTWSRLLFDFEYDDENNLVGCPESGSEDASFSISRVTFGPGVP